MNDQGEGPSGPSNRGRGGFLCARRAAQPGEGLLPARGGGARPCPLPPTSPVKGPPERRTHRPTDGSSVGGESLPRVWTCDLGVAGMLGRFFYSVLPLAQRAGSRRREARSTGQCAREGCLPAGERGAETAGPRRCEKER